MYSNRSQMKSRFELEPLTRRPGGANVPSWNDTLPPLGEYDWIIRLRLGVFIVKCRHFLPWAVQKWLNRSICCLGCGLEWAEGCTSSIIFARWRQWALVEGHVAVTCRITSMRFMANYFDHLLSLDTPTYAVAQIAKRFEPSTVLWAFFTMQPSSYGRPM